MVKKEGFRQTLSKQGDKLQDALDIAKQMGQIADKAIRLNEYLVRREAEAAEIIESLLAEQEQIAKRSVEMALLREAARRHLSSKKAAKAKGRANEIQALAKKYETEGRPKRSINKAIAADLGMTPQGVGKARRPKLADN
jgi:hypothetical protein